MPELGRFARELRAKLWKPSVDDEVRSEIEHHIQSRTQDLIARGIAPSEARTLARREFGDVDRIAGRMRALGQARDTEQRRAERWLELRQDVQYAVRQLARSPGFAVVSALTIALGVGATTAIFSVVDAVILRPLPFREPERLVRIYSTSPTTTPSDEVSPRTFLFWRRDNRSLERLAALESRRMTFAEGGQTPESITAIRTTPDYFPMLGVAPQLGRVFSADEERPNRPPVAVISHRFWMRRFNGDRAAVGRVVRIDASPVVIVGVMPAAFDVFAAAIDVWVPITFEPRHETVNEASFDVVARLRPGVTIAQAQSDLSTIVRRIDEGRVGEANRSARVAPYTADMIGGYRSRLFILFGAVAFVLLIGCVNVANLLLARGAGRAKEIAIRAALGAGRGRIIRQLLAESAVLGAIGGAAGLALAYWALALLKAASPEGVPRLDHAGIGLTALAFTLAVTLASALAFGLVPAVQAARPDLHATLVADARSSTQVAHDRTRQLLVVLEVALSLVLLAGATLLIRSAILLQRVDPGLDPSRLWSGAATLPSPGATPEQLTRQYERIVEGMRRIPGVEEAAVISVAPFTGLRVLGIFPVVGRPIDERNLLMANLRLVTPGAFHTLRIPIRRGRDFSDRDDATTPPVVIVNEAYARLAWPGEDAVGKKLWAPGPVRSIAREVVGVVGDTHEDGLREAPRPAIYYTLRQVPPLLWSSSQSSMFLVARTGVEPLTITKRVQAVVHDVDRGAPVFEARSMEDRMAAMVATARFNTQLLTTLGGVGLALAVIGIYGVIAYFVGQRTREIGVRMALGATPGRVLAMVVGQGMRPVLAGIVVGMGAALALTRVLASQLYGVRPTDPPTFAAVATIIIIAAALAAAIPARRAARVDPKTALGG
jgi:putative ABC transport system permease protein